jgi:lipopolysaccharide/colanic/teichoic acid biosynthesis glycosyltransferase
LGLTANQVLGKRVFDLVLSFFGLLFLSPLLLIGYLAATISTGKSGIFSQERIGRRGRPFNIFKLRTMKDIAGMQSSVTTRNDIRITPAGKILRLLKIDELPQLWNVLIGDMSIVGPRPDVRGFADRLTNSDKIILSVRPGITGPASLKYQNEELMLAKKDDPESFNLQVIWPDKVKINRKYVENYLFYKDILFIIKTVLPGIGKTFRY